MVRPEGVRGWRGLRRIFGVRAGQHHERSKKRKRDAQIARRRKADDHQCFFLSTSRTRSNPAGPLGW
jgi:hypothetical protein